MKGRSELHPGRARAAAVSVGVPGYPTDTAADMHRTTAFHGAMSRIADER